MSELIYSEEMHAFDREWVTARNALSAEQFRAYGGYDAAKRALGSVLVTADQLEGCVGDRMHFHEVGHA